jgi:hypothetical protein
MPNEGERFSADSACADSDNTRARKSTGQSQAVDASSG